jgi:hypothetical protein
MLPASLTAAFNRGAGIAKTARLLNISRPEVAAHFALLRKRHNQARMIAANQAGMALKPVHVPKSPHSQKILVHLGQTTSEFNSDQTSLRAETLLEHSRIELALILPNANANYH